MWGGLEKILEHVTSYSTNAGKVWYLLVFVFRLIVVVTVGQSVYSDEQSAFRCSTKVIGCDNVCYDKFSKISHIRYWAFQLLAISAPAVVFHFYSLNVRGRVEKLKAAEGYDTQSEYDAGNSVYNDTEDEMKRAKAVRMRKKMLRRQKSVRGVKEKKIYQNNNLVNVTVTREIRIAYLINVFIRFVLEGMSLYLAYNLYHVTDYTVEDSFNPLSIVLIKVPQVYLCEGENVEWACGQHLNLGKYPGYVPCWVSRPWEKTIFMCYMNILSAICFILSVTEFVQLLYQHIRNRQRKVTDRAAAKRKISTRSEVPTFQSVDSTSGNKFQTPSGREDVPRHADKTRPTFRPGKSQPQELPNVGNQPLGVMVPLRRLSNRHGAGRDVKPKRRKSKIKKKPTVGITLQGDSDDEFSQGSLYHSSEYERSSDEEEDESLNSVSIRS